MGDVVGSVFECRRACAEQEPTSDGRRAHSVVGSLCKCRINDSMKYTADATGRGGRKTVDQRGEWAWVRDFRLLIPPCQACA